MATGWSPAGNLRGPQGLPGSKGDKGDKGDAGNPASATTDASALTSGILPIERMPAVTNPIRTGTLSTFLTPDAARAQGGTITNLSATGDGTLNAPTNPTDGQIMRYRIVATGANRSISFGGGIVKSTGLTLGPYPVPRGAVLICAIEYVSTRQTSAGAAAPAWVLTAATVSG